MPNTWNSRISGEYRLAFDLCAAEVQRCGGPCVVQASHPFYARELLKRIEALRPAQPVTGRTADSLAELRQKLGPEVELARGWSVGVPGLRAGVEVWTETAGLPALGQPGRPAGCGVWAEPEAESADRALGSFRKHLAPGGRLCAILSGPAARLLPEWVGEGEEPAPRTEGLRRTVRRLRQGGFAVETVYGFHGPASAGWSQAYRLLEAAGRRDLADRALARARAAYVVRGWQAPWAPVRLILAQRLGEAW